MQTALEAMSPTGAAFLLDPASTAREQQAAVELLDQLRPRAAQYFSQSARFTEEFRNALVLVPITWTWISVALAYAEFHQLDPAEREFFAAWETSAIDPQATVVVTASLLGLISVLSVLTPFLFKAARGRAESFLLAVEAHVLEGPGQTLRTDAEEWAQIRAAFADAPTEIKRASEALREAFAHETAVLSEVTEARSKELRRMEAAAKNLEGILQRLLSMDQQVEAWGARQDAALGLVGTTLTDVSKTGVDIAALLDELQRDREVTVKLLESATGAGHIGVKDELTRTLGEISQVLRDMRQILKRPAHVTGQPAPSPNGKRDSRWARFVSRVKRG